MNTDNTAAEYSQRAIRDLGQQAHDSERMAIWCYDNPPKRPLPKSRAPRELNVFLSRLIVRCAAAVSGGNPSALVEAVMHQWIHDNVPEIWSMYQRHEQEAEQRIAELRHNEPTLQEEIQ